MASRGQRLSRGARRTLVTLVVVLGAMAALLLFCNWAFMAGPASRIASRALHRPVRIEHLSAHLLSWTPTLTIDGLRVANTDWAGGGDMIQIPHAEAAIELWRLFTFHLVFAHLEIDAPTVRLQRDAHSRMNWDFSANPGEPKPEQPPSKATSLPAIRRFTLSGGELTIEDAIRKLKFTGSVAAHEGGKASRQTGEPFNLQGHGEINGQPFDLQFGGGALLNLQLDQPYQFQTQLRAGELSTRIDGSIDKPFDLGHFGATLDVRGQNLAALYYLTGLALPFTPPFHLAGQLRRDDLSFTLEAIDATVGDSDLHGVIKVDAAGKRPVLSAELTSHGLDLEDLAPSVGAGEKNESAKADANAPGSQKATGKLLPDYKFDFDRMRSMDADVELRADAVKTQKIPMKAVDIKLALKDGRLKLNPVQFTLPEGQFVGLISINAQQTPAVTEMDLRLRDINLAQFKGAKMPEPPIDGTLDTRAQLQGAGNSVHDVLSHSSGMISAIVGQGSIREAFAELLGIDAARGLGLLLSGSQKQATLRCGVAVFDVKDGRAQTQQMVFDTDTVLIRGSGDIDFDSEKLALQLKGQPKKFEPLRLRTPVLIGGTLVKPTFGVDAGKLALQGGVAAALGVVATPLAAVIAFIDPGLAKNQDCAQLTAEPAPQKAAQQGSKPLHTESEHGEGSAPPR